MMILNERKNFKPESLRSCSPLPIPGLHYLWMA